MSSRIAVLAAGLAAMLALAPADAAARSGHWHGGGGYRGGFGVFIGPPFPAFRPYGYGYRRPYYGYGRPYAYLPPPAFWPPSGYYYAPSPYYAVPPPYYYAPPPAYFGTPLGGYLPPSGLNGGYKR